MKRFILLLLTALFILGGCGNSSNQTAGTGDYTLTKTSGTDETNNDIIIIDKDGIKITYTGIELIQYLQDQPEAYMLVVKLNIENNSTYNITVLPMDSSVNGVMKLATSGIPLTASSGNKAITQFQFAKLDGTGIDSVNDVGKVENIEFTLSILNDADSSEILNTGAIKIIP